MNWIFANWTNILSIATTIIAAASAIAALTPSNIDDPVIASIRRFIDVLALNVGQANQNGAVSPSVVSPPAAMPGQTAMPEQTAILVQISSDVPAPSPPSSTNPA